MNLPNEDEPSSTSRLPDANQNRHGDFHDQDLQDIFLSVQQNVPKEIFDGNECEEIRWDLGNPADLVITRRENEGRRSIFDVPDVVVNAVHHESDLRPERATSLRPRNRRRETSVDSYQSSRRARSPSRLTDLYRRRSRSRSPSRSSFGSFSEPSRFRRSLSRQKRRRTRSPSSSSDSSCEGCDDPHCGKEFIVLTDEVKRCLMEHPVFGKGLFIRDPSKDTTAWYVPKPGENLSYPPYTYDAGSTNALFYPFGPEVGNNVGHHSQRGFGRAWQSRGGQYGGRKRPRPYNKQRWR